MHYQNTQALPRKGHLSKLCELGNFQEDHTTITLQDLQHSLVDNRVNTHQQTIALVLQNTVEWGGWQQGAIPQKESSESMSGVIQLQCGKRSTLGQSKTIWVVQLYSISAHTTKTHPYA